MRLLTDLRRLNVPEFAKLGLTRCGGETRAVNRNLPRFGATVEDRPNNLNLGIQTGGEGEELPTLVRPPPFPRLGKSPREKRISSRNRLKMTTLQSLFLIVISRNERVC